MNRLLRVSGAGIGGAVIAGAFGLLVVGEFPGAVFAAAGGALFCGAIAAGTVGKHGLIILGCAISGGVCVFLIGGNGKSAMEGVLIGTIAGISTSTLMYWVSSS